MRHWENNNRSFFKLKGEENSLHPSQDKHTTICKHLAMFDVMQEIIQEIWVKEYVIKCTRIIYLWIRLFDSRDKRHGINMHSEF